jgi:sugar lactone lactonase YvrE
VKRGLSVCLAAMAVGCGGSQPPIVPGAMPFPAQMRLGPTATTPAVKSLTRSLGYKVTPPLLFVTNYTAHYDDVRVYRAKDKDPTPLATISDGIDTPSGVCIDGNGTVYVTNQPPSGPGWISEYPLGQTAPLKMVTDGISAPAFCAIDARGNLWVTNLGASNVSEYLHGATKPHTVITDGIVYPVGIAIDRSGNLYAGNGWDAPEPNVEIYAPGSKSPSRTITDGVTWPVGIAVDSDGTLYVANASQNNITEYRSGQDVPFQTITKGLEFSGGCYGSEKRGAVRY